MAYTNLPPALQDIFYKIQDRVSKLETGPNSAQYTADAAATDASQALSDAALALAQASAAYTLAGTAIQGSTNTILNATNQMTAINANGITVYSGASSTTGARVVLNSDGIAGFNSSGSTTFAIDATNGNVSMTGALFTGGTIYGGQLNINGNCVINTSGFLTATGATITGTITSVAGSIGGWTITSTQLRSGGTYIDSSTNIIYTTGGLYTSGQFQGSNGIYISGGASTFLANVTVAGYLYNTGYFSTTGAANMRINTSSGLIAYTSSSQRYKVEIEPQTIPVQSVLGLVAKSYVDKTEYEQNNNSSAGLQRWIGLIAEDIAELPVLKDLLVEYKNNEPNSVYYDRVAVALIPLLQDHETRLAKLEGK
jgi:hypothetical protein